MEDYPVPIIIKTRKHKKNKPSLKALIAGFECRIRFRCNYFFVRHVFNLTKTLKACVTFNFYFLELSVQFVSPIPTQVKMNVSLYRFVAKTKLDEFF
jgi:hypothetical protein